MAGVKFAALLLMLLPLGAQPLTVYTEFALIDARGKVAAPATPREVLSPAAVRNGFTSLQIVVDAPAGAPWELYVAQNPENAVELTLYRVRGEQLEKVSQPARGSGPGLFWLDMFTRRGAPVERIKVEPQLYLNNDWVIYPMEVRIMQATIPDAPPGGWPPGAASPVEVMRGFLCGGSTPGQAPSATTLSALRFRNAQQDRALAAKAPRAELAQRFGPCNTQPPADNPEWYLRIRDYLFRLP
jgi:hypothetical protein